MSLADDFIDCEDNHSDGSPTSFSSQECLPNLTYLDLLRFSQYGELPFKEDICWADCSSIDNHDSHQSSDVCMSQPDDLKLESNYQSKASDIGTSLRCTENQEYFNLNSVKSVNTLNSAESNDLHKFTSDSHKDIDPEAIISSVERVHTSRYTRALQLLKNSDVATTDNYCGHQKEDVQGEATGCLDSSIQSEIDNLYDFVSDVLLNKEHEDSNIFLEDSTENKEDKLLTPQDFTAGNYVAGKLSQGNVSLECVSQIATSDCDRIQEIDSVTSIDFPVQPKVNLPKGLTNNNFISRNSLQERGTEFDKIKEQVNIFYVRIKIACFASAVSVNSQQLLQPSRLEVYVEKLKSSLCLDEFMEIMFDFKRKLENDVSLASLFLTHFTSYIMSVLDIEESLISINEFVEYFLPSVKIATKGELEINILEDLKNSDILPMLLKSLSKIVNDQIKCNSDTADNILKYRKRDVIKAHIVRMQPVESQTLFQETFSDTGNLTDLYIIYIWRILKLYELDKLDFSESSVVCLSDTLEDSGKYLNTVPIKELKEREAKIFIAHMKEVSTPNVTSNASSEPSQALSDMNFEWADFRIGQIYENGVVFLTNMTNWLEQLERISCSIHNLEVKKYVKFVPALGTTYGLFLQDGLTVLNKKETISYVRVRVMRVAGPIARVYGIDTGTVFMCEIIHLFLLPATVLNTSPCGRLALLPVVPAPSVSRIAPSLKLLVYLSQKTFLEQHLSMLNICDLRLWLQVPEFIQPTLQLLKCAVKTAPLASFVPDLCLLITDFLIQETSKQLEETNNAKKALSILISAMEASQKIRLLLAKEGAFITLCELGLKVGGYHVWNVIRMLIGGKETMESWLHISKKILYLHNKRHFKPWKLDGHSVEAARGNDSSSDMSPAVCHIAAMPNLDRNWDLEVRRTIHNRQLVSHSEPSGWQWGKNEVLKADISELHHGHKLDVQNDETHHIILDKSVPNIRMNTILQIILGMLNTGLGGKIYIGLSQLGIVQGVRMTIDQRDCFMLGFSKLVTSEIFPMVLPCDSLIQFIPVVRPGALPATWHSPAVGSLSTKSTSYVVVLTVRAQPNVLYRYRSDPEPIFMREGGVTSNIRGHRLTQLNVALANRNNFLQQQVSLEKQAMLNLMLSNECN